jgi:hypothetical protein
MQLQNHQTLSEAFLSIPKFSGPLAVNISETEPNPLSLAV